MSGKTRSFLLSLTIIAVILFSAFGTTSAYADGGTTPDPPPVDTGSGSEEAGSEATEAPSEATAVPEETTGAATEAPAEETAVAEVTEAAATEAPTEAPAEATATEVPTEAPVEATTSESAEATEAPIEESAAQTGEAAPAVEEATAVAETSVLDAVPDNTTVAVIDANGEVQPLATQAAADAVATSDPVWCPTGALPGDANCTPSFTSFTALLQELAGNSKYTGTGTIYVQQGAYLGGEASIQLDPVALSNISGADLTVAGGWNPATNATDPATPSTFSNTPILIGSSANPWGGSLILSNIVTSFATNYANDPNHLTENGLSLYATGGVTLVNVQVGNAPNNGAEIEAGGDVTIIDSAFDRNQIAGAKIKAGGSATVVNSSFSNPANGRRQDTGLDIESTGAVTLIDVLANENRMAGTNINTGGGVSITNSVFSGTKNIQGTNFLGYGLHVVTPTTIDLFSVTANDNFLWGANLQAGGNIAIFASQFNANTTASPGFIDDTGLFITGGGNVDLNDVTANDNRLYGAKIDAVGAVAINIGSFSNNRGVINTGGVTTFHGHGLAITSQSNISLNNVNAINNMLFGAQLTSTGGGNVNVSNSTFSDTSTGSTANAVGEGLDIVTAGSAILANVVLDNNQTVGADIQAGNVTLSNVSATNNGSDGVAIQALCTSVNGGMFSGNGGYGLNLGTSGIDPVLAPTFSNNTSGNLFPATPAICTVLLSNPTTPANTASTAGSSVVFAAVPAGFQPDNVTVPVTDSYVAGSASASATLKSILSNVDAGGFHFGIFIGQYAYIYTETGLQVFVLSTPLDAVAVRGVFRAY